MSLSAWEQQALDSIKEGLAGSDPELAALLASFTELASGEEMPVRKNIRLIPPWVIRRPRRERRHRRRKEARRIHQFLRPRNALVLWLLITAVLIGTAVTLSRGGGHGSCQEFWPASCAHPAPASSPPTPSQGT
jgi:Protein of unknown function (DUF3040)